MYISLIYWVNKKTCELPGHSKSLHVLECSVSPLQSVAGVTPSLKARHDLQRVCDPELQDALQDDQAPQVDQAPTGSVEPQETWTRS